MDLTRKKYFVFFLMGIMAFSVLFVPVCSTLCSAGSNVADVSHGASCTFSSHSFTQFGIGLSSLFILSLVCLSLVISSVYIPKGSLLSLFRPPRFQI
jgi:hypothetical protein